MRRIRLERELTILQNISNLNLQITENEAAILTLQQDIQNRVINAPIDGVVTEMQLTATNVPIVGNQTVAYLLPQEEEMIFYANVSADDVERIHIGDVVNIRLVAYADTEHEMMSGEIIKISDISSNVGGIGPSYRVEIKILEAVQPEYRIGLNGSCEVIVGQRTVLEYFLEPFLKGMQESLKE